MANANMLKVVIIGDGGTGKSSLLTRFVNNEFDSQTFHTIGVEFLNKTVQVGNQQITLQIWDTAGQERFRSLRTPFYRGADSAILVFDLTDRLSFDNLEVWYREFLQYAEVPDPSTFAFILLGNKVDAPGRQVSEEEAQAWCAQHNNIPYFETSAKTSKNVEEAFIEAAARIHAHERPYKAQYDDTIDLRGTAPRKPTSSGGGGCCSSS